MKPSPQANVMESASSIYWIDEQGVLCMVYKKDCSPLSMEERRRLTEEFAEKLKGKKICGLMDITYMPPSSREIRQFNTTELPKVFKAMAFITRSAIGKMVAQMYLGLRPTSFPARIFSSEQEAREWLKQHL